MGDYYSSVEEYYSSLISKYGDDVRSTDWGGEKQQHMRFDVLLQSGAFNAKSILDVGCGRGDLFGLLKDKQFNGVYYGVDITEAMVNLARRRYPDAQFDVCNVLESRLAQSYDYVLASGIFYIRQNDNKNFFTSMLSRLFEMADTCLAFNMLSSLQGNPDEGEYIFDPAFVMAECFKLTPFVTLRHEYKKNDFSVYLYHSEQNP